MGVVGRRICAALAAGSASLHAAMLGHASGPVSAGLLAVMLAACLYCAVELWRDGNVRAWVVVALMNLAMIAVHLPAPAHHHGASAGAPPPSSTLMTAATLLAVIEVLAATTVLYLRSRNQLARLTGTPDR